MATRVERLSDVAGRFAHGVGVDPRLLAMLGVLLGTWVVLDLLTGGLFLTARNLFNLSLQVAVVGIMATGMVLVIVARHIDLSVGSQIGFIGVLGGLVQTTWIGIDTPHAWWLTSLIMIAAGVLIGGVQGALVAYGRIPAFVVTLGGLLFLRNAAYQLNDGKTIAPLDPTFQLLGGGIDGTLGAFWSWVVGLIAVAGDRLGGAPDPPQAPGVRLRRAAAAGRDRPDGGLGRGRAGLRRRDERLPAAADRHRDGAFRSRS